MSIYLLVFLLLAAGTLLEYFRPQSKTYVYWICWAAMTGCLCFRFGQGTDYVTYHGLYETIPVAIDLSQGYICGFYPEIGWRLLSAAFKVFGAPFWVFASYTWSGRNAAPSSVCETVRAGKDSRSIYAVYGIVSGIYGIRTPPGTGGLPVSGNCPAISDGEKMGCLRE